MILLGEEKILTEGKDIIEALVVGSLGLSCDLDPEKMEGRKWKYFEICDFEGLDR